MGVCTGIKTDINTQMALSGCPDAFLHPYYQDNVEQTAACPQRGLVDTSFTSKHISLNPDDDVDLEALVNDMNSSLDSLYSTCSRVSETVPLLKNGQLNRSPLSNSGTNTLPSMPQRQKMQRSQPMQIQAVRRLQEEQLRTSSLPAIPNPFPELCTPASSPVLAPGSLPQNQPASKRSEELISGVLSWRLPEKELSVVKVFSEDGTCKMVEILADMTSRDFCQLLIYKSHCVDDNSWTLVEHHPHLGLERCLEDHEVVWHIQSMMTSESKFLFRKNYAKYEFFKNPVNFFPEQMVAWCQQLDGSIPKSELLQNFLNANSCPEIQGSLHVKEVGKKSWKKVFVCLRRSGLYCSTKGTSKEPRHLQGISDLEDSNIYSLISCKKLYNSPTDFGFCVKPNRVLTDVKEMRFLCAEDEQTRTCWMTAFRLLKYGMLLYQNYRIPQQKTLHTNFSAPRSVSENCLVAMDFSGQTGRVIENPLEAQSAAVEEGHAWRKRSSRLNVLGNQSPLHPSTLSTVVHRTQPWFHGRIPREESHTIIKQQGLVDGLFLLRDSQSNPKAFVLTLCHHQKIKHFQILPCEEDGQMFFSLDDGNTKFTDLIQLVEFYQLNKGVLPCKLKYHCIRVAL
ncbi:growth factor receptor-bound protein 10 isoform X4 [Hyla sarda]|uniref:growth factor receptor-bound protein 10 isoform X4 n=1 Tax=Hyla sarda TaxID=327740 RepID=UPI0024C339F1|nr:growth factor receptor-bound protein 10 isoform X4 [Hyla sarda]